MTTWFEAPTFTASVRAKRGQRGLREVSAEIGTDSPSTLSRVERGTGSLTLNIPLALWLAHDAYKRLYPCSLQHWQPARLRA